MRVIQKINNNAVVCIDGQGKELVAFGSGIGFKKVPYELTDLSKIEMTFYKLNSHYFQLLNEIPDTVFAVSSEIVKLARRRIQHVINPNLIFTLADHINFTLERVQDNQQMKFPFSYDVKQLYPQETKVARLAVDIINRQFHITLPDDEVTAITMHLVNSGSASEAAISNDPTEQMIAESVGMIEKRFKMKIDEDSFTYNRFAMHMRYYIRRLKAQDTDKAEVMNNMVETMKRDNATIYNCAHDITDFIDKRLGKHSDEDEVFYVAIYVRRMVNRSQLA